MALQPYKGANTAQFYVAELTPGVTPTSPSWSPLRVTGGVPAVTRDALVSNELDGSREVSSVRTGSKQVGGEYPIELSSRSQDELLAGAMTSTWQSGTTVAGLTIDVAASAKTFTRSTGDFTTAVEVGDLVHFPGLAGGNSKPFIATSVSPLVITGSAITHDLTNETDAETSLIVADKLETGNQCKTYSILTWFKGTCGTADSWLISRGVEFTGFTIEHSVNAFVSGSFPFIGRTQQVLTSPPAGSDFSQIVFDDKQFSSADVSVFDGAAPLRCDTLTFTNENAASAQFELGETMFIERGKASNTFSISGKLYDMAMIEKFIGEVPVEVTSILSGVNGAMSFTMKRAALTGVTPEVGGAESVTQSIEGQATGNSVLSSIVIQRIAY